MSNTVRLILNKCDFDAKNYLKKISPALITAVVRASTKVNFSSYDSKAFDAIGIDTDEIVKKVALIGYFLINLSDQSLALMLVK